MFKTYQLICDRNLIPNKIFQYAYVQNQNCFGVHLGSYLMHKIVLFVVGKYSSMLLNDLHKVLELNLILRQFL